MGIINVEDVRVHLEPFPHNQDWIFVVVSDGLAINPTLGYSTYKTGGE